MPLHVKGLKHLRRIDAPDMRAPTDWFTSGFTYFSRSRRSKCTIKFWVNQGRTDTYRHRCAQRLVISHAQTY